MVLGPNWLASLVNKAGYQLGELGSWSPLSRVRLVLFARLMMFILLKSVVRLSQLLNGVQLHPYYCRLGSCSQNVLSSWLTSFSEFLEVGGVS